MTRSNCLAPAAVRMTMRYPFWTEIFYSMEVVEDPTVETAATDGRKFWVNPTWWKTLSLEHAVGVMAHELCHKIFLHCTRQGTRDSTLWNVACDYAINSLLKANGFSLPSPHLHDAKYDGWLAEAIYADLLQQQKAQQQKAQQQKAQQQKGPQSGQQAQDGQGRPIPGVPAAWDQLKDVRQQHGSPEQTEKHETEVKALVDRAIANAKARGTLPSGIEAGAVEVYRPSKEPWYNRLHRYMQSLAVSEYNWARLNRRTLRTHGYFSPLHLSEALGEIAVFIDTSGSCAEAADQANFFGHLNAIMAEARPHRVHLYSFDARVYPAGVIEAGELDAPPRLKGGGGTRFEPIFEQIDADGLNPALVLVLTDMYGSFPNQAPGYPVVWCATSNADAPFGETVHVD